MWRKLSMIPLYLEVKYSEEITNVKCAHASRLYKNICSHRKEYCVAQGKAKCSKDDKCMGIMYHVYLTPSIYSGVAVCTSRSMNANTDNAYSTYMNGMWRS